MTITNPLKDSVKTTIIKVLVTAKLMIIDFMLYHALSLMRTVKIAMKIYTSQSHHIKTEHSDDNQNQRHPTRKTDASRPAN